MVTSEQVHKTLVEISATLGGEFSSRESAIHAALSVLVRHLPQYTSVSVYTFDGGVLNLDTFVGTKPAHSLVPVGQGIVGQAAAAGLDVMAGGEAAVLMRDRESSRLLGVLHVFQKAGPLEETDRVFLAAAAQRLASLLLETPK